VGRDLLLDAVQAVADEDAASAFAVAGRAVDWGYDLRAVCRELSRLVRDLLVVSVDPSRLEDPEIAGEGDRDRVKALADRFSREDLLRAFDVLTKAEADIRTAAQPRHHLEMAFLRWIYLRRLVPIEDLIAGAGGTHRATARASAPSAKASASPAERRTSSPVASGAGAAPAASGVGRSPQDANLKDALLAEIRKSKLVFYNTVVAQAQRIDVADDCVTFTFSSNHRALREMFDQNRGWIEAAALQVSGRRIAVVAKQNGQGDPNDVAAGASEKEPGTAPDRKSVLREQALADAGVQAMLEIFPAEIRDVEEM
jgi:DNA polymerase III gamma/tau subunit